MVDRVFNVLFLCTGNSGRSILAEALLNHLGAGRFRAFSAGSFPKRVPHPFALDLLDSLNIPTDWLYSKSWNVFTAEDAPTMDFVLTVCHNAANEPCPVWPGHPTNGHWDIPDPAAAEGDDTEKRQVFARICQELEWRIKALVALPADILCRLAQHETVDGVDLSALGDVSAET